MFSTIASLLTGSARPERGEASEEASGEASREASREGDDRSSAGEDCKENLKTEKCDEHLPVEPTETEDKKENFSIDSLASRPVSLASSSQQTENTEEDGRERSTTNHSKETRDGSSDKLEDEARSDKSKSSLVGEPKSNPKDEPGEAKSTKFFKRKLFDVDQSLVGKFDLHLKELKHRTLLNEKLFSRKDDRNTNDTDRSSDKKNSKSDKQQKCKKDKPEECRRRNRFRNDTNEKEQAHETDQLESDKTDKQSDKLANKSKKAKSSSRLSKWLYNKFKHSDDELSDGCEQHGEHHSKRNSEQHSDRHSELASEPHSDPPSDLHSELTSQMTSLASELNSELASELNSEPANKPLKKKNSKPNVDNVNKCEKDEQSPDRCKADAGLTRLKGMSKDLLEELIAGDAEDVSLIEERIDQLIYTSKLYNLRRKLLKDKKRKARSGSRSGAQSETGSDSSDDDCNCCKDKLKKLKSEQVKLKNQLKRKSSWRKCVVFLNPIFLLAVFFYLLYSELTAVRAEPIGLPGAAGFASSRPPRNLLESSASVLANLRPAKSDLTPSVGVRLEELAKLNKKKQNNLADKLNNKSDKSLNNESGRTADGPDELPVSAGGNVNEEPNQNEANQSENAENSDFASLLNQPMRIPISKRNFFGGAGYQQSFDANKPTQRDFDDALLLNNLPQFKVLAILPTTLSPQLSRHLHRAMALYYAYTEGLVSGLELSQYFEHLRFPNGAPSDLSSSLHHLQLNASLTPDMFHHHNEKIKFLFHANHSELNFEDHLFSHLIQRIHHRNRTQHYSQSNSLYPPPADLKPLYHDPLFATPNNQHHLNEKQLIEHFIQTNRKRLLRPSSAAGVYAVGLHPQPAYPAVPPSSPSSQFASFSQQPEIQLSLLPLGNSSSRLISSLCDSVEIQRPTLILSLVDPARNYYLEMLARISDVPMLTLTSEYEETASLQKLLMEVINRLMQSF